MKRVAAAVALSGLLMVPGVAAAGSSTDAALGLGAFAVLNQIISGTGVFGGGRTVIVERPVVVAPPPPPVVYAPPPVVVYPSRPAVVYEAAPAYGYYVRGHRAAHPHWRHHHHGDGRHRH
jgi:hypothetical protein